ncbi:hypothetical protein [Bacillus pseudomycoides]|uniref:hypothetical protein n=1 Tax=Bacillus pseudomycoides TaxID=64104 RepID=UPI000BEE59D2|nr:hypothetical protein [Bacillus pseudomycoides]PDY44065.1 hypothetical protein CON79_27670 [Bacillus pseudomycoides]PHB31891.1 hypothetical protein COE83_29365 [Bacillus pseudomycoides]
MKYLIKNDLKRSFINYSVIFLLILGVIILLIHLQNVILPIVNDPWRAVEEKKYGIQLTSINMWLGNENGANTFGVMDLYYAFMPFLVVLPYASSYLEEWQSQYQDMAFTRVSWKKYFVSRYISIFISGSIAYVLPLVISFFVSIIFFKNTVNSLGYMTHSTAFLSNMHNEHPIGYMLYYLAIITLYAGTTATVGFAISSFVRRKILVLIIPLLLAFIIHVALFQFYPQLSFFNLIDPRQPVVGISIWHQLTILVIWGSLGFIGSYMGMRKHAKF